MLPSSEKQMAFLAIISANTLHFSQNFLHGRDRVDMNSTELYFGSNQKLFSKSKIKGRTYIIKSIKKYPVNKDPKKYLNLGSIFLYQFQSKFKHE